MKLLGSKVTTSSNLDLAGSCSAPKSSNTKSSNTFRRLVWVEVKEMVRDLFRGTREKEKGHSQQWSDAKQAVREPWNKFSTGVSNFFDDHLSREEIRRLIDRLT